jgi:opacity protein-like surface antigen
MRTGLALTIHRFASLPRHMARYTGREVIRPALALVAGIFFAAVLAAQAQESVEPDVLPALAEPPASAADSTSSSADSPPSSADAPASTSAEPLPALPKPLPSTVTEPPPPAPSLPTAEEAFPTTAEPLSSSRNYTAAQTSVVPGPVPAGPNGVVGTGNAFPGAETIYSGEPRRFHYVLGLTVRGVWDDNIFLSHNHRVSDYYFAIEPYITLGVGDIEGRNKSYLRLDNMPSAILFVDHPNQDAFNQLIHLEGGYSTGRLTLSAYEDIALLESANLNSFVDTTGLWANTDASGQTRVNIFNTRLRADYELTGKLFLQGEFDSSIYFYPHHISSYMISSGLYIYYNWLPKVWVGVGGTVGYDWVDDPTPNQTFEQVNARLNYEVTSKFFLYASAGVEFRQFDGNRGEYTSPVFEVGSLYYPFSGTIVTLAAGRRIYNSGFIDNQDYATTYIVGRVQQRLFQRVYLGLGAGYENSDYFATTRNVSSTRNDDYWFIEPSVDVLITRWLSAGVYYLHRQDSSDDDFFSFYDNQVGVRATVRF